MFPRPKSTGIMGQRLAAAAPLALFLCLLGICSYAGRDQLNAAIKASGVFIAAQFGQGKPSAVAPATQKGTETLAKLPAAVEAKPSDQLPKIEQKVVPKEQAATPKVLVEIDSKGKKMQILDVPIPEDCYPQQHADYAGDAVVWGLGHKQASAADCCAACKEHQRAHPNDRPCNIWVWCGDPSGICWTMDIHNHTTGDCWLKHQAKWDNNPDRSKSNLEVNHEGKFSAEFRSVHKTSPELVPWVAGVIPAGVNKPAAAAGKQRMQRLRRGV